MNIHVFCTCYTLLVSEFGAQLVLREADPLFIRLANWIDCNLAGAACHLRVWAHSFT